MVEFGVAVGASAAGWAAGARHPLPVVGRLDRGAEPALRGESEADRLGLEPDIAFGERLAIGRGEGAVGAAMEVDRGMRDSDGSGRRLGVAGRGEGGEERRLALRVEADVAAAALAEAAVGRSEADLPALRISARSPVGGGGRSERLGPGGGEDGIAAARAVEAHQAEAGLGRGILAPSAAPQGGEERRPGGIADAARLVFPVHRRV